MRSHLISLSLLFATGWASIPSVDKYRLVWSDDFNGPQGSMPTWNRYIRKSIKDAPNGEQQLYTEYASNAHLSGDGQLYIVPKKSQGSNGPYWTSARLETPGKWACPANKAMLFRAEIRVPDFTGSPDKYEGLWPAFWTLGDAKRTGKADWPRCGEWDIFEVTNWLGDQNQAILHYANANNVQLDSRSARVTYTGGQYHTWAIKVDRRNSDWRQQKIIWYLDGKEFHSVSGAEINSLDRWKELAWAAYYIVLNVAVGGAHAHNATAATIGGFEASMRVKYVAVYESL